MDSTLFLFLMLAAGFSIWIHASRQKQRANVLHLLIAVLLDEDVYRQHKAGLLAFAKSMGARNDIELWTKVMQEADRAANSSAHESAVIIRNQLPRTARGLESQ